MDFDLEMDKESMMPDNPDKHSGMFWSETFLVKSQDDSLEFVRFVASQQPIFDSGK